MFRHLIMAAGVGAALAFSVPADAGSRYATPPPVTLSPNLTSAWTLQLKPMRRVATAAERRRAQRPRNLPRYGTRRTVRTAAVAPQPRRVQRQTARQSFPRELMPTTVRWHGGERPGTIIVDTIQRRLFLVMHGGKARRYAVGVGKPGFEWAGSHKVTRKAHWPDWRPPAAMIAREAKKGRHLPTFMAGGPDNPMGARALYLGSSIYRIHGTNQDWSIGKAVSSGCIRMRNVDVMDLYERVGVGTRVKVI